MQKTGGLILTTYRHMTYFLYTHTTTTATITTIKSAVLPVEPGIVGSHSGPTPPPVLEENLLGLVERVLYGSDLLPTTQPPVSRH